MEGGPSISKPSDEPGAGINQQLHDLGSRAHHSEMEWRPAREIAGVGIDAFLGKPVLDILNVPVYDGRAESGGVADVGHLGPVVSCQRIEGANLLVTASIHVATRSHANITHLSTRVISDEGDFSRDINLSFRLGNFLLLICLGDRAVSTAVIDNILDSTEKSRVTMKIDLTFIGLVPLGIEY